MNKATAYVVGDHLFLPSREENVFDAQARLVSLWKEIALPNLDREGPAIRIRSDIYGLASEAWSDCQHFHLFPTSELWRLLPWDSDVTIWDLRIDPDYKAGSPFVPMIAQLERKANHTRIDFVSVDQFSGWSAVYDPMNDGEGPSYLVDVWMGKWDFAPVHGDHLRAMSLRAEKIDAPYARQLRRRANEWQDEIDIAAERANAPRV
jgi:hypothetical protein